MAKKTRTELSTLAINTNLPDNTQELITPTTERSQLTDERESVINYKDDLGGAPNAGKFLTVATDGESLTMVDAPTGDVTGTGVAAQVTFWNGTSSITSDAMLVVDDTNKILKIIIPTENASGGISIDQQGTTGSGSLQFLDDGLYKAQIVYDVTDGDLTLNSNGDIKITPTGDTVISGGTPIVEHVRIKSGGDVGIGTTPSSKLHIRTSANFNYEFEQVSNALRLSALNDARDANIPLEFAASEFNFITGNVTIGTAAAQDFYLALRGGVGGFFGWDDSANKTIVQAPNTRALSFQVNSDTFGSGTEALTITSGGTVLIGQTTANSNANGFGAYPSGSGGGFMLNCYNGAGGQALRVGTTSTGIVQLFIRDTTTVGSVSVNTSSTSFNTTSDYRLKENVTPITDALSRLNQLKPSRFNFIGYADNTVDGFIAHEVQDIIPEAICGEKDAMKDEEYEVTPKVEEVLDEEGNVITEAVEAVMETRSVPDYQGIDQSKIVPLLTAAIQEQQTIIDSLIIRLEALEA